MVYKKFGTIILIRIIFLSLSIFALFYLLDETKLIATTFIVFVLIVIQIYAIIYFVKKTNREITRFFNSIKYSDFSQSFKSNIKGSAFEELSTSFSEVIEEFRKARTEKEEHFRYLQTVVQHVSIGLVAYTSDGNVELINNAAKRLLNITKIKNISELSVINSSLVEALIKISAGEKILVKVADGNELSQLSIHAAEFKLKGNHYTLTSISNIQSELEEKEMEAWQNLIRVLTHEIMNSVTPIVSLSSTASLLLEEADQKIKAGNDPGTDNLDDVKEALSTIIRRSKGLLRFIDDYRNLTRIPVPNFQVVPVTSIFERINKLFSDQFKEKNIQFTFSTEPANLEVTADPDLIEQVIINLILNSFNAVSNTPAPKIDLTGTIDNYGKAMIQVSDNGQGVPEELYEKIFIPFFTTRKEGSGIGLSLSRQIMRLHKGGITVKSIPNKETIFTLRF
jgi:two-component system, NtrC family, nitrogen regulation sensor histidine kinase NtrY